MAMYKFIGFKAVAKESNGNEYDASFMISFPIGSVNAQEINTAVNMAVAQFLKYHPNGSIVSQMERTVNMAGM